jgi:hypothetical protein
MKSSFAQGGGQQQRITARTRCGSVMGRSQDDKAVFLVLGQARATRLQRPMAVQLRTKRRSLNFTDSDHGMRVRVGLHVHIAFGRRASRQAPCL